MVAYQIGGIRPYFKIAWYEMSLDQIRKMLHAGESDRIIRALDAYRSDHRHPNPDAFALEQELSRD